MHCGDSSEQRMDSLGQSGAASGIGLHRSWNESKQQIQESDFIELMFQ